MSAMFIVLTLIFIAGYAGFIRAINAMMQEDALFDIVSRGKWSKFLNKIYPSYWEKVLGGCAQCTSFWWVLPYMIFYIVGMRCFVGWPLWWLPTYIWLMLFWGISSLIGFYVIRPKNV